MTEVNKTAGTGTEIANKPSIYCLLPLAMSVYLYHGVSFVFLAVISKKKFKLDDKYP